MGKSDNSDNSYKPLYADGETHHVVKVLAAQRGISITELLRQDYVIAQSRNGNRGARERTPRKRRR